MQLNPAEISELIKSRIEGLAASSDIRNRAPWCPCLTVSCAFMACRT